MKFRSRVSLRLAAFLSGAMLVGASACTPQSLCAESTVELCQAGAGCDARLIDPNTWESTPLSGTWHEYPGNRILRFSLRDGITGAPLVGEPYDVTVLVSTEKIPSQGEFGFAPSAGNLSEIRYRPADAGTEAFLEVQNTTCAQYYARVVVRSAGGAGGVDSGGD